jgi:hypothetical protein
MLAGNRRSLSGSCFVSVISGSFAELSPSPGDQQYELLRSGLGMLVNQISDRQYVPGR